MSLLLVRVMRAVLVSLVVIAAAASIGRAQDAPPVFGVFGGATLSRLVGVGGAESGISDRTAASFGAYALAPLNPSWSLQIGASYMQKGWRRRQPGTLDTTVVKLDYFELPIQLRFDIGIAHAIGAFAAGGFALAVRGQCSESSISVSAGDTTTVSCAEVNRLSGGTIGFNSVDAGPIFTGGLRFAIARVRLLLFAQYERGLLDVSTNSDGQLQAFTFGGGVEWRFGR